MSKEKIFLYSLFYFIPFIDALNGYLIFNHLLAEGSIFTPGQIYRLYIVIFSFFFIEKRDFLIVYFLISFMLLLEFISFSLHGNIKGFAMGIVYSYKLIYIFLIYFTLKGIIKEFGILEIVRYFRNSAFIYALILLLSVFLGIDRYTYTPGTFGTKGLFASGNGLSIFLGASSLVGYYYYKHLPTFKNLFIFFIIFISSTLVGTKASIIFLFIILFIFFVYMNKTKKIIVFLFSLALLSVYYTQVVTLFSSIFDVIIFRYEKSESLFAFLASNRDNFVIDAFNHYNVDSLSIIPRIVFGAGVFLSFRDYSDINLIYDTLENDFFDIFFSFGVLGLLVYLGIFLIGFIKIFQNFNLILFLGWLTLFAYSFIAGHMIFNAMSSMTLVLFYLIITKNSRRYHNEKNYMHSSFK